MRGTVVSFDRIKGYGFVAAESGGDDVFLHVNDLLDDKSLLTAGSVVEFVIEEGDRGPKASSVTVVRSARQSEPAPVRHDSGESDGDDMCDVLSIAEFEREITEMFLHADPTLTGAQIMTLRNGVKRVAQGHGWVDR